MKPQFEEHEGKLFKMLDKPVPLTPDAEMPCLVRLIQDDSPMGKYNQDMCKLPMRTIEMCIGINRQYQSAISKSSSHYARYEVIGCHVAEGSKEWALYQMMQWKIVCHKKSPSIMYCKRDSKIMREVRCGCVDFMSIDAWLNGADRNGWQLYKEPESQYKVGDWVEVECQNKLYHKQVLFVTENRVGFKFSGTTTSVCFDGTPSHIFKFIRKLDPSEVVLDFGSGIKGTIVGCSNVVPIVKVFNGVDWIASIMITALDTQTSELVKSLLKAQEEEK